MKLNTVNGRLKLGSVYKLFFTGWLISWGASFGVILVILIFVAAITGTMTINGEEVQGFSNILPAMLLMGVMFPIIIFFHAIMFSGLLTFGIWLYRLKRPLEIVSLDQQN